MSNNDNVRCIAYVSADCAEDQGILELEAGEHYSFSKGSRYTKSIKSMSVKHGCQLTAWKGISLLIHKIPWITFFSSDPFTVKSLRCAKLCFTFFSGEYYRGQQFSFRPSDSDQHIRLEKTSGIVGTFSNAIQSLTCQCGFHGLLFSI